MQTIRIATWNLERCATAWRREAAPRLMSDVAADIWILTETVQGMRPDERYVHRADSEERDAPGSGEHWASIVTRFPITQRPKVRDPKRTTAAVVQLPSGRELAVFATVLPWHGDQWGGHASAGGHAFTAAVELQAADWTELRREGTRPLCVAGDFNQDLSETKYYGSASKRRTLESALRSSGLTAWTGGSADPVRHVTPEAACIDHICASEGVHAGDSVFVGAREPLWSDRRLSDHPVVWALVAAV